MPVVAQCFDSRNLIPFPLKSTVVNPIWVPEKTIPIFWFEFLISRPIYVSQFDIIAPIADDHRLVSELDFIDLGTLFMPLEVYWKTWTNIYHFLSQEIKSVINSKYRILWGDTIIWGDIHVRT